MKKIFFFFKIFFSAELKTYFIFSASDHHIVQKIIRIPFYTSKWISVSQLSKLCRYCYMILIYKDSLSERYKSAPKQGAVHPTRVHSRTVELGDPPNPQNRYILCTSSHPGPGILNTFFALDFHFTNSNETVSEHFIIIMF